MPNISPRDEPNQALWLTAKKGRLELRPASYRSPGANEIAIRNRAVAINPVDRLTPAFGGFIFPWLKYPAILGSDVAGEVVEVGSAVTRFKVGDRVVGHALGTHKTRNNPAEGGFQLYSCLLEEMAAPIPQSLSFEQASVLPLGLSTAACGLFETDQLALDRPTNPARANGKSVLIWGGSSSVGSNAIQLAVAAGYEVVTTCSPKNFDYVRKLGASQAFDYKSPTVVADVLSSLRVRSLAGALAIGTGSSKFCLDIVHACDGAKAVAQASMPIEMDGALGGWIPLIRTMARLVSANMALAVKARLWGIRMSFIFGSTLVDHDLGGTIYRDFLPAALAEGRFVAAPDARVVGQGLDQIPVAMDALRQGVSALKLVVKL